MPPVRLGRDGDVAELILDAPPLNRFDASVLDALEESLGAVEAAPPRALIVRAERTGWSRASSRSATPAHRRFVVTPIRDARQP